MTLQQHIKSIIAVILLGIAPCSIVATEVEESAIDSILLQLNLEEVNITVTLLPMLCVTLQEFNLKTTEAWVE